MKYYIYILTLFLLTSLFYGCSDDDNFSTSSSLRLEFSTDTVSFDTLFTTIGSATKRLKIYNRNKDAITISNIDLVSGGSKGFRLNVDGESGNNITDVDILSKDSIYIFVEVTVDPLNKNNPILITDSIRFGFNGVTQYVALEAIGQDAILWKNKTISKDTTLTAFKPYLIYGGMSIDEGVTLDIKEGVSIYFHRDATLQINGKINALGTISNPIVMRGDRMDNLFDSPKVPYDRVHGQWGGIIVAANSYNNRFENVRIRNGVYGIVFESSNVSQQKATILNTTIQNTTKETLLAINSKLTVANSLLANSGTSVVRLLGGDYTFVQNTIANYISSYWGFLRSSALIISNTGLDNKGNQISYPLLNASFGNTIIAGSSNSELNIQKTDNQSLNYIFRNCLIKNNGSDDEQFINIVWGVDPVFKYIYSAETAAQLPDNYYYYNFELTQESPARAKGARTYAAEYPLDILGISRLGTNPPDIGCYQWVSSEK